MSAGYDKVTAVRYLRDYDSHLESPIDSFDPCTLTPAPDADAVRSGRIPTLEVLRGYDDDEVVDSLTSVRGIGRLTAEMQPIFLLDRPDVFPPADAGIRRDFERVRGLGATATLCADVGARAGMGLVHVGGVVVPVAHHCRPDPTVRRALRPRGAHRRTPPRPVVR